MQGRSGNDWNMYIKTKQGRVCVCVEGGGLIHQVTSFYLPWAKFLSLSNNLCMVHYFHSYAVNTMLGQNL